MEETCLCSLQGHGASSLWEPLIPADGNAYGGKLGLENFEACVTWIEVEFLLVPAHRVCIFRLPRYRLQHQRINDYML